MTLAWFEGRRAEWPVTHLCRVLWVSRSGVHAWRSLGPSAAQARREALTEQVAEVHARVKGRYGSPRVHAELVARGTPCCENTVARVVRGTGIAAEARRKFRRTTDSDHPHPVAPNVLDRQFGPPEPNAAWVADVTYVPTREGWLELAVVADLFSRTVVGWSTAATVTSRLVVDALEAAVGRLPERPSGLVAHSDRGSQYASEHYRRRQGEGRITRSMGRRGNCSLQRADGGLLREPEEGAGSRRGLRDPRTGDGEHLRVHRGVLQPRPAALLAGVRRPGGVRAGA